MGGNGRFVLSAGNGMQLWDVESGRCVRTFDIPEIIAVCLTADGQRALTAVTKPALALKLWDLKTGRCLRTFGSLAFSVCLSADGRFALSGDPKYLALWEVETGHCLRVSKVTPTESIPFA